MTDYEAVPTEINLRLVRGDSLAVRIDVYASDGDPANLTDYTASGRAVGRKTGAVTPLTVVPQGASAVLLTLAPVQTSAMDQFSDYDLQIETADQSERFTFAAGVIQIQPQITE